MIPIMYLRCLLLAITCFSGYFKSIKFPVYEMKLFPLLCVFLLCNIGHYAQSPSPLKEVRAVWVASVTNIDWPTSKNLTPAQQRSEFITLLDRHKQNGINTIIAQIRPTCDAFYISSIEPWSEWLTGTQGTPPNPLYDPLTFMIEEAHKRGMELHAWVNPYRAVLNKNTSSVHSSHVSKRKPQWVKEYGVYKWLDPGNPEVMDYVTSVIMDVVRRYDIDGIHFDDYFYPYPQTNVTFEDDSTFILYPRGFTNKDDWRRNNVNMLVKMVHDSIKSVKKHVKFGISPFGIWRNQSTDPNGSATSGFQSYDQVFADSRKWIQEGWVDYINPQIYWNIGFPPARFEVLTPWWNNNAYERQVFVGHAAYKIGNGSQDTTWLNPTQMGNQIRLIRTYENVKGSVFFSSKSITNNLLGVQDSLRNDLYKYPSLIPPMPWLDSVPSLPPVPGEFTVTPLSVRVTWSHPPAASDGDLPFRYILYKYTGTAHPDSIANYQRKAEDIVAIIRKEATSYTHATVIDSANPFIYLITSADRLWNESAPEIIPIFPVVSANDELTVTDFSLQAFPNPFNPVTTVTLTIPEKDIVSLDLFDMIGRKVRVIQESGQMEAGKHTFQIHAAGLASGTYLLRAAGSKSYKSLKIILLK